MVGQYAIPKFRFAVEIGDIRTGFTEISGLDNETDVIEYREGDYASKYKSLVLGLNKAGRVTLKRGVFNDAASKHQFWLWYSQTIGHASSPAAKREVKIKLMGEEPDQVVLQWVLTNAMAVKLQSTDLKSDGNEVAIESLELAHEGIEILV